MKRKPSRKSSEKILESMCGQPGPEDGLDPRDFFKPARSRRDSRKDWQLCRQVFEASFDWSKLIHCQHNHVSRERHADEDLWVHRKGALPADVNVAGVIPGSMGSLSFHVAGRGEATALRSSSHGAGRTMARQQARQKISRRDLNRQMQDVWFDRRLADELRDEAPAAYKEIGRVMRAQRELTRIVRELRPVLVYKGV